MVQRGQEQPEVLQQEGHVGWWIEEGQEGAKESLLWVEGQGWSSEKLLWACRADWHLWSVLQGTKGDLLVQIEKEVGTCWHGGANALEG